MDAMLAQVASSTQSAVIVVLLAVVAGQSLIIRTLWTKYVAGQDKLLTELQQARQQADAMRDLLATLGRRAER